MPRDFGAGKARESSGPGEVTAREQQGRWVKHENGEGETERKNMHCKTPFYRHLCACDSRECVHVHCVLGFSWRKKKKLAKVVVCCVTLFGLFPSLRLFRLRSFKCIFLAYVV